MAEDETLDLRKNNSPRRRALLSLFRSDNSTVAPVSRALEDDLFGTEVIPVCEAPNKTIDLLLRYQQEWGTILAAGSSRGWK